MMNGMWLSDGDCGGLHEGRGMFGAPSMKPVDILGINHYRVAGNRIQEEWVTFDGLDVLKQIYLETEDGYVKQKIT